MDKRIEVFAKELCETVGFTKVMEVCDNLRKKMEAGYLKEYWYIYIQILRMNCSLFFQCPSRYLNTDCTEYFRDHCKPCIHDVRFHSLSLLHSSSHCHHKPNNWFFRCHGSFRRLSTESRRFFLLA